MNTIAENRASDTSNYSSTKDLDNWVEQLYECHQLNENQVKILCDKVSF